MGIRIGGEFRASNRFVVRVCVGEVSELTRENRKSYFPTQPIGASDNLKEGFEMGPPTPITTTGSATSKTSKFKLSEPNVWPDAGKFEARAEMEKLYTELQELASRLLSLLAVSLGKDEGFFSPYLEDSLSTLRLLHYPPRSSSNGDAAANGVNGHANEEVKLSCTQHTDSGILTLLHQDPTGGLEVQDSTGKWVPAPYVPGSMVVNIGDLMAEVSGGRFVATMHRVRAPMGAAAGGQGDGFGRFSVPFFFEPGEKCVVRPVDDDGEAGKGVVYGDHVREKMKTWVEFRDEDDE